MSVMNLFRTKKDKEIELLRKALIKIHDNPYDRDLIVKTSQEALFATKKR